MAIEKFKNFAQGILNSDISADATSLTLQSGQGDKFPDSGNFRLVIWSQAYASPEADSEREIVLATARSGDTFTISRNPSDENNYTNKAWSAGDKVALVFTSGALENITDQCLKTTDSPTFAGLTVDTDTLYIDSTNHYVGIGTASPNAKLDVKVSESQYAVGIVDSNSQNEGGLYIDDSNRAAVLYLKKAGSGKVKINSDGDSYFIGGNIGIGTMSPQAKLEVNGDLGITSGILQTTPAPDSDIKSIVNREYVDSAVTSLGASYYMTDDTDGDTGYKVCSLEPPTGSEAYIEDTITAEAAISGAVWISKSGEEPAKLLRGIYGFFIEAEKTDGTKGVRLYWKMYELKSDESTVLIGTSTYSNLIETDRSSYIIPLKLNNDYELSAGSRVYGEFWAIPEGTGADPTIRIYYQGDTSSRWDVPANNEIFKNIFIPYTGATQDVDLGSYGLTVNDLTIGSLSGVLKASSGVVSDGATTDDLPEGSSNLYWTQDKFDTAFSGKTTDDLSEGSSHLYWTQARFDSAFSGKTTDDLSEGSSNLYFSGKTQDDLPDGSTYKRYNPASVNITGGTVGGVNVSNLVDKTAAETISGNWTHTGHLYAGDHGTASTDEVVNVCYGTGDPPTASTTTIGTLYIQYEA